MTDSEGNSLPRRAGVHSFGVGGVNADLLLEEFFEPVSA
jgi:acyl transferase domain-containing protein